MVAWWQHRFSRRLWRRALIKLGISVTDRPRFRRHSYRRQRNLKPFPGSQRRGTFRWRSSRNAGGSGGSRGPGGLSEDTVVTRVTGGVPLPDFKGLSLREVAFASARYGFILSYRGEGRVVGQRPVPQTLVSAGTVCEVVLSEREREKLQLEELIAAFPPGSFQVGEGRDLRTRVSSLEYDSRMVGLQLGLFCHPGPPAGRASIHPAGSFQGGGGHCLGTSGAFGFPAVWLLVPKIRRSMAEWRITTTATRPII